MKLQEWPQLTSQGSLRLRFSETFQIKARILIFVPIHRPIIRSWLPLRKSFILGQSSHGEWLSYGNWGKWVPKSWGRDLGGVSKLSLDVVLLNRWRINITIYIWYFSLLSIAFLKFCMMLACVKVSVVPFFKYPNFWPHLLRNCFQEKLVRENTGSRKRKGKKTIKTVVQAQFHRGLFLLILEDDSGINYTLGDGITVSKFHTLQSLVNWIINSLASSSVLWRQRVLAISVEHTKENQRCGPQKAKAHQKRRGHIKKSKGDRR